MTQNIIRQIVRAHLEESSRERRQQTRATIAAASDLPTTKSGRVDLEKQIALTGYNLAKDSAGMPPKYGFTMTSIQKVGINPSSGFNTPLALYAYPVTPMMVTHLMGGKNIDIALNMPEIEDEIPKYAQVDYELPFVANAPYINFFGYNTTEGIYYTSSGMDDTKYRAAINRLFRWLKDDSGLDVDNPEKQFRQLLVTAQNYNMPRANLGAPAPAGQMTEYQKLATVWSLTRALSMVSVAADFDDMKTGGPTPTRSTISTWRSLLLMLGIKAVVDDDGKGLIHKQEPEQIAIMDTSIIETIQQFDNVTLAAKRSKESNDLYWKRNPESLNKLVSGYVTGITKLVKRMHNEDADKNLVFLNLTQELAAVYMNNLASKSVAAEIRKLGLIDDITDFAVSVIPMIQQETFDRAGGAFAYIYAMTGSKLVLEAVASRLVETTEQGFINLAHHIGSIHREDTNSTKYIIEICELAFAMLKDRVSQYPNAADEMLRLLASSKIMPESMNIGQFRQLINPIYKAMPDDMKSDRVTSIASGRSVSRMDSYLELFGEYEVNKALGINQQQVQALDKKKLYRPETTGLYANLGDIDKLRHRLQDVLHRARSELYNKLDILNDKEFFFKSGSRLDIDDYKFAPGQFIQTTIQSATYEQLQKVTAIWIRYANKIRKTLAGPDILNILHDISQDHPGLLHGSAEYDDLMKAKLFEHAQLQVAAIHEAIEDLEKEMTAQIESMDDKRAETAPLYERVLHRLKSRLA